MGSNILDLLENFHFQFYIHLRLRNLQLLIIADKYKFKCKYTILNFSCFTKIPPVIEIMFLLVMRNV